MKIQNVNNYMNYTGNTKPIKNHGSVKNKNYDVIDIKNKSTQEKDDIKLSDIKKNIVSQLDGERNGRIDKIKESVDNGTYKIDVDEIANKLLR